MKSERKGCPAGFTLLEFIVTLTVGAIIAAMVYAYFGTSMTRSGDPVNRLQNATDLSRILDNIISDYNRLHLINLRYKWKPSTAYSLGAVVVPTTNNGHFYTCTAVGTSGTTEPTWPTTTGAIVTNGGVTWRESGNSGVLVRSSATATYYASGSIVVPYANNGHYYKCTAAGTIAQNTSEPAWPTASDSTVVDSGVTWTEAGTILYSADTTNTTLKDNLQYYLTNNPGRYGTGYTVVAADTKFIKFNSSSNAEEDAASGDEKNLLKVTIRENVTARTLTTLFTIR
jgi:prepilin-type N-terminal cleavage/methylation domain-containing protein